MPVGNGFVATNVTIAETIAAAYDNLFPLPAEQIVGAPMDALPIEREVMNGTSLDGRFDLPLTWTPLSAPRTGKRTP